MTVDGTSGSVAAPTASVETTVSSPAPVATPAAPSTPPRTMSDALQQAGYGQDDVPGASPETPPTLEGSAPATAEPSTPVQGEAAPVTKEGPIPFQAHKTALDNARVKEREAVIAQLQQELTPIKAHLPIAQAIARDVETGGIDGLNQLLAEYARHPQLGPQLRSMMGRALGQLRGQAAPVADTEPEPDLESPVRDAQGQVVGYEPVFSAKQLAKWQAWNTNRIKADIGQQFAPMRQLQERFVQAQEQESQTAAYVQRSSPLAEELKAMPGFEDHKQEIAKKQQALFDATPTADPMQLWFRAYREVVPSKLQAQQQQSLESAALAKAAGRDANPAAVVASPPPTPQSMREALAQVGLR